MYIKRWFLILVLAMTTVSADSLAAQGQERPLVVFIIDDDLRNASVYDPGPYGLYQLEQIFSSMGADTDTADLRFPLPEAADVVVLVGPKRRLPGLYVANLWTHLNRGNHLLLAIDPPGQFGFSTDQSSGGLARLLDTDFGIAIQDALVAEPWFTTSTIAQESTAFSRTYPEAIVRHPIVSPLVDHDLPVEIWGARSMVVEPLGVNSQAAPLLVTHTAFGELNRLVFAAADQDQAPIEINPAEDLTGPLIVGALAENTQMQSRVVVLGDAELMQNGFGLAIRSQPTGPLHPGNRLLVERVAAWLLELPLESLDVVDNGFTNIVLDGDIEDWSEGAGTFVEVESSETTSPEYDFQRIGLLNDGSYLYVAIETPLPPPSNTVLKLEISTNSDIGAVRVVRFDADTITVQHGNAPPQPIPDAKQVVGTVLEVRLPMRIIEENSTIETVCLTNAVSAETENCIRPRLELGTVTDTVPLIDARFTGEPLATVLPAEANLRSGPSVNERLVTTLTRDQIVMPVGRNQDADWIKVQNASHSGWIATFLIAVNTDVEALPVISTP